MRSRKGAGASISTGGRVLLDTSAVVGVFTGDGTARRIVEVANRAFMSTVTSGELYYGAERSSRRDAHLHQVHEFLSEVRVVSADRRTAHEYGTIKQALRRKGRPLPDNDLWIAAVARRHQLPLATRDNHFHEIEGIALIAW